MLILLDILVSKDRLGWREAYSFHTVRLHDQYVKFKKIKNKLKVILQGDAPFLHPELLKKNYINKESFILSYSRSFIQTMGIDADICPDSSVLCSISLGLLDDWISDIWSPIKPFSPLLKIFRHLTRLTAACKRQSGASQQTLRHHSWTGQTVMWTLSVRHEWMDGNPHSTDQIMNLESIWSVWLSANSAAPFPHRVSRRCSPLYSGCTDSAYEMAISDLTRVFYQKHRPQADLLVAPA